MPKYAVMSGPRVLGTVSARDRGSARKKAQALLAREYAMTHSVRIVKQGKAK